MGIIIRNIPPARYAGLEERVSLPLPGQISNVDSKASSLHCRTPCEGLWPFSGASCLSDLSLCKVFIKKECKWGPHGHGSNHVK